MSGPFAFLPRKVGQPSTHPKPRETVEYDTVFEAKTKLGQTQPVSSIGNRPNGKGNTVVSSTSEHDTLDLIRLLELSLSDYAVYYHEELQQLIMSSEEGWVPLTWLLKNSDNFKHLSTPPTLSLIAKAIRTHVPPTLEIRMTLAEPSMAVWRALDKPMEDEDNIGGYDIRRVNYEKPGGLPVFSDEDWDIRTIYIERLPHAYWSVPRISRFIDSLLSSSLDTSCSSNIQHIRLPSHHLDKPGSIPRCKGFAFVTLTFTKDVKKLLHTWPWDMKERKSSKKKSVEGPVKEAQTSGLRCLSKKDWDRLEEQYLSYREYLLATMPTDDHHLTPTVSSVPTQKDSFNGPKNHEIPHIPHESTHILSLNAPFPPGCLLFMRHVHPQTNRTALRALLGKAVVQKGMAAEAIDYVDYSKGMDNCYIRVVNPSHALALEKHFNEHHIGQSEAGDSEGGACPVDVKPISIERVLEKREELYWEKVPEKVRRIAVERVRQAEEGGDKNKSTSRIHMDEVDTKKPKRRRKA